MLGKMETRNGKLEIAMPLASIDHSAASLRSDYIDCNINSLLVGLCMEEATCCAVRPS